MGNAGFVDLGDLTVVFDTFVNTVPASELKKAAERATGRPVEFVFNSHAHRDHVKGNQVFADATVVATEKTAEVMTDAWKARTERVLREGLDPIRKEVEAEFDEWKSSPLTTEPDKILWDGYLNGILDGLGSYQLKLPGVTFDSAMTLRGSKRSAVALTYGGGHSKSDLILYLPEDGIVFLGDLLFIGYQPFIADGDPGELVGILDRVLALDPKKVVPGHGPVGTKQDLASNQNYVLSLERIVDEARRSKEDILSAAAMPEPAPFNSWKWHGFYEENLKFLFERNAKQG